MTPNEKADTSAPVFFTMGDAGYFLGGVALVNSLRLVGHRERIVYLDLGMTSGQRALLAEECDVVDLPMDPGIHPFIYQSFAQCFDPHGVAVVLDSDVIVTQRLDDLLDRAANGKVVVFPESDRFVHRRFAVWQSMFDLPCPPRAQPYVNSGFVAVSTAQHPDFLSRWWDECHRWARIDRTDAQERAFGYADQDVLNALLMAEIPECDIAMQEHRDEPMKPWELTHTTIDDLATLRCTFAGAATRLLHSTDTPKPWRRESMVDLREGAYVRCLKRLLTWDDVALRPAPDAIPPWLRSGVRGSASLKGLQLVTMSRRVRRGVASRVRTISR